LFHPIHRGQLLYISFTLITGVIVGLSAIAIGGIDFDTSWVGFLLSSIVMLVVAIAGGMVRWKRNKDYFDTGILVSLMFIAYFIIGGIGLKVYPEVMPIPLGQKWLNLAMVYASLGLASFWIGYGILPESTGGNRDIRSREMRGRSPKILFMLFLYVIGAGVRIYLSKLGVFSYAGDWQKAYALNLSGAGQLLQILSDFSGIVTVAFGIEAFSKKGTDGTNYRIMFWLLTINEIIWGLMSGMKGKVIWPFEVYILVYWYCKHRLPKHAIVVAFLVLIFLVPINTSYRALINTGGAISSLGAMASTVGKAVSIALDVLLSPGKLLEQVTKWYVGRNSLLLSVGVIASSLSFAEPIIPRFVYAILPIYAFIPRTLWPGKPVLEAGRIFAIRYFGMPQDTRQSTALSIIGDALLSFGVVGIIVCLLLLGIIYKAIYRWHVQRYSKFTTLVYIALLVSPLLWIEGTIPELVVALIRRLVGAVIIGTLLYRVDLF